MLSDSPDMVERPPLSLSSARILGHGVWHHQFGVDMCASCYLGSIHIVTAGYYTGYVLVMYAR